jgi:benzoate/toluate 1,2-dioxygenase reductase subunit
MAYDIVLQFEDGVTRKIPCNADETVADAAYRAKVNIPLDCRDGACGTCKCKAEAGTYTMGVYIDEALTDDEAAGGYVLTCQMYPTSDCVVAVPVTSAACKMEVASHKATLIDIDRASPTTVCFTVKADAALTFLPGQYVNLGVPGTTHTRAYSFSSPPGGDELSFLIRDVPGGLMSGYMREKAAVGDAMTFVGPYGHFFLRPPVRPILMLAGGTGLAPFLSMLGWLKANPASVKIRLAYGVNTDADLVEIAKLDAAKADLPDFDWFPVVVDGASSCPRHGYVTDHLQPEDLNGGDVDVYVCGPPPMVEGVRRWMAGVGVEPKSFLFEKFSATHETAK